MPGSDIPAGVWRPETLLRRFLLGCGSSHQRVEALRRELRYIRFHTGLDPPLPRGYAGTKTVDIAATGLRDL
jgi:hypothetical protein